MKETYTIDASGKKFGRIASQAAKALMGKHRADYTPNIQTDVVVEIINADELEIAEVKMRDIEYKRYSGFPGGQKVEKLGSLIPRRGIAVALQKTIGGMLPDNTMWTGRMKRLVVKTRGHK